MAAAGVNAVDSAVAAAATLAVVTPEACGVGGDALMLVDVPGAEPVAAADPRRETWAAVR